MADNTVNLRDAAVQAAITEEQPLASDAGATKGQAPKANIAAVAPPTVNDDSAAGYSVGSVWLDQTAAKEYKLFDDTAGAAVWVELTATVGPHAPTHESGGADEISVAGLSGVLVDAQTPAAHAPTHESGGADEISVAGLSGALADDQSADAIRTTDGPTLLSVGAIADGEFLQRSGAALVGATPAGGGAEFNSVVILTTADNGTELAPGVLYFADLSGGDVELDMPDPAGSLTVGDRVLIGTLNNGDVDRLVLTPLGVGALFIGLGMAGVPGELLKFQGDAEVLTLRYAGTALGVPAWYVSSPYDRQSQPQRRMVDLATAAPLPAFTSAGAGPDQILTASANGELTVDGVGLSTVTPTGRGGVLVAAEVGADRQYHGAYEILSPGDGGTPWELRRRTDWAYNGNTQGGASCAVLRGTANAGKVFTAPFVNIGDAFDFVST